MTSEEKISEFVEEDNGTLAISYSLDCLHYATGGRDKIVRVYDEQKGSKAV
jgi:hypothetical protein